MDNGSALEERVYVIKYFHPRMLTPPMARVNTNWMELLYHLISWYLQKSLFEKKIAPWSWWWYSDLVWMGVPSWSLETPTYFFRNFSWTRGPFFTIFSVTLAIFLTYTSENGSELKDVFFFVFSFFFWFVFVLFLFLFFVLFFEFVCFWFCFFLKKIYKFWPIFIKFWAHFWQINLLALNIGL